jgi:hypothetical protein
MSVRECRTLLASRASVRQPGQRVTQPQALIDTLQQQGTGIRTTVRLIELRDDRLTSKLPEQHGLRYDILLHKKASGP